jgi:nitrate/nitrite-specific signal transduction histidine kinase
MTLPWLLCRPIVQERAHQDDQVQLLLLATGSETIIYPEVRTQDEPEVQVADNGVGIPGAAQPSPDHYGLLGMRERAAMIGAQLTITPELDRGTIVSLRLKLPV